MEKSAHAFIEVVARVDNESALLGVALVGQELSGGDLQLPT